MSPVDELSRDGGFGPDNPYLSKVTWSRPSPKGGIVHPFGAIFPAWALHPSFSMDLVERIRLRKTVAQARTAAGRRRTIFGESSLAGDRRFPGIVRIIAAVCILAIGLSIIVLVTSQSSLADRDYITYWASGRQLLAHQNPYYQAALAVLDRSAGSKPGRVHDCPQPAERNFLLSCCWRNSVRGRAELYGFSRWLPP